MERSHARVWMLVVGATAAGMLITGCASGNATVIGVPPSSTPVNQQPVNSIDAAVNAAIASELAQANENQSDGQPAESQVELDGAEQRERCYSRRGVQHAAGDRGKADLEA